MKKTRLQELAGIKGAASTNNIQELIAQGILEEYNEVEYYPQLKVKEGAQLDEAVLEQIEEVNSRCYNTAANGSDHASDIMGSFIHSGIIPD